jgi:hypothetical protein
LLGEKELTFHSAVLTAEDVGSQSFNFDKILEKVLGCNDVGIYNKKFSDHSQTQKAVNKRRKIQKLSADSDYGACYSGLGDEEMMDMPEATFQKIQ